MPLSFYRSLLAGLLAALLVAEPCLAADVFHAAETEAGASPTVMALPGAAGTVSATPSLSFSPALEVPTLPSALAAPAIAPELAAPEAAAETAEPALAAEPAAPNQQAATPPQRAQKAVAKILKDPFEKRQSEKAAIAGAGSEGVAALPPADGKTEAPRASPPAPRRMYLLSEPLHSKVSLGVLSRTLHYSVEISIQIAKFALALYLTSHIWAAAMLFLVELPRIPISIAAQSGTDLKIRSLISRLKQLNVLAKIPGVERIKILTTSHTRFSGLVAAEQNNQGFVFLESTQAPPQKALRIDDPSRASLHFDLIIGHERSRVAWDAKLSSVLEDRAEIPAALLDQWRGEFEQYRKSLPALKSHGAVADVTLEVSLIGSDKMITPFGAIAQGPAADSLLGLTHIGRAKRWLRTTVLRGSRGVPLSDTEVSRDPAPSSWPARAALAARRLFGRLVVISREL